MWPIINLIRNDVTNINGVVSGGALITVHARVVPPKCAPEFTLKVMPAYQAQD